MQMRPGVRSIWRTDEDFAHCPQREDSCASAALLCQLSAPLAKRRLGCQSVPWMRIGIPARFPMVNAALYLTEKKLLRATRSRSRMHLAALLGMTCARSTNSCVVYAREGCGAASPAPLLSKP